jgi:hypothetical protein
MSYITSVYTGKKSNRKEPNYRGLNVNNTLCIIYTKVLQSRLHKEIRQKVCKDQSGFKPERSCVDNMFILQQLADKKKEKFSK